MLPPNYSFEDVARATKLRRAFSDDVLAQFGDLRGIADFGDAAQHERPVEIMRRRGLMLAASWRLNDGIEHRITFSLEVLLERR